MRRDRKAAQKKKQRTQARTSARASALSTTRSAALSVAEKSPFGPAYLSGSWRSEDLPPELVSAVVTRALPDGTYIALIALVDRTCLGVKNAFVSERLSRYELDRVVEKVGTPHDGDVEEVDSLVARSVIFAAIEYAAELGFRPHRDLEPRILGPRPDELEPTPLADRARPFYVPGPHDDVRAVRSLLTRAVGPEGFDIGSLGDVYDEVAANDDGFDQAEDEAALSEAVEAWLPLAARDPRIDLEGGLRLYARALTGEPSARPRDIAPEHMTSLPTTWAALFRPLAGGATGLDLAREHPEMEVHGPALAMLSETRATLFDILAIDEERGVAVCREIFADAMIRVRLGSLLGRVTRWTRMFAYVTPMDDGTLYTPSTMYGHRWLRNVDLPGFFARLNELSRELALDVRVDPTAPVSGLTRLAPIAYALLQQMVAPTEEEAKEASAPLYFVNSDGERFEHHEAVVEATPTIVRALVDAMRAADDFVESGDFLWMREPRETRVIDGEHIASIAVKAGGELRIVTSSKARFEGIMTRLSSLAAAKLVARSTKIMRPWEELPRAVAEETPESRRIVFGVAAAAASADPRESVASTMTKSLRAALDEDVPLLGGRPRDLVTSEDGRRRVDQWLADQEVRGIPGEGGAGFLDLDDLRRELGLPTVSDEIR